MSNLEGESELRTWGKGSNRIASVDVEEVNTQCSNDQHNIHQVLSLSLFMNKGDYYTTKLTGFNFSTNIVNSSF
jgi:hypothetical protein